MMNDFDPILLDYHLGHLSAAQERDLRERLAADPALAAQEEALRGVFAALGALAEDVPAPRDLAARTIARVRAVGPAPRVVRPPHRLATVLEDRDERVIRLGSLRDIVAIAALVVLAVGVGLPGMLHMRDRQQRAGCSWNLAQLGTGLQQYARSFNANLPFAGFQRGENSWQPSAEPGVVTVPNRRHIYPLLRLAFVRDPRLFVCPSQQHVPMPVDEVGRRSDFLESRNVSYAYQNMAGVRPSADDDRRLPLLADENPLFADGVPLFDSRRWSDPAKTNSAAHKQAGQNILNLTGEVQWATTPNTGVDGDNIWTLRGVTHYTGVEGPQAATDSHLLK